MVTYISQKAGKIQDTARCKLVLKTAQYIQCKVSNILLYFQGQKKVAKSVLICSTLSETNL